MIRNKQFLFSMFEKFEIISKQVYREELRCQFVIIRRGYNAPNKWLSRYRTQKEE